MSDISLDLNPAPKHCPKCGAALVAQTIRGLCPNCLALLAFTPEVTAGGTVVQKAPAALSATVRFVGDYELLEEIGRGGMGVVFKANQSTLKRTVAVKMILSGEYAGTEERKRFQREAASAAQLQHPNIVAIHQVGEHEGRSYFSMDLIEGRNLAQQLRDGKWRPQQAAALVQKLADAVHFAHQRGTLHRDLKPHNIIIDPEGEPHILDFGLARPIGEEKGLTHTGDIIGSPSYMSPEQANGTQVDIGPATDVYGLGTLLYELITGQAPFTGCGPMEILAKVANEDPLAPRRLNSSVPKDLETICLKCLEKRPERRYHSARALSEELQRFLSVEPILARPAGRMRRAWSWVQRSPWAIAGAGGLAAFVLLCVACGLWEENQYLASTLHAAHPNPVKDPMEFAVKLPNEVPDMSFHRSYTMEEMPDWAFAVVCPALAYLLLYTGKAFRKRHWRQLQGEAVMPGLTVGTYAICGGLGAMVGMHYLRAQIHLWMWHLTKPSIFSLIGSLGSLATVGLGLRMIWEAAGTRESSKYQNFVNHTVEQQFKRDVNRWPVGKLLAYGTLIPLPLFLAGIALQGLNADTITWVVLLVGTAASATIAGMATWALRNRYRLLALAFIPVALGIFALPLLAMAHQVSKFDRLLCLDLAAAVETIGMVLLFARQPALKPFPHSAWRDLAGALAGLACLVVLFYVEENARGRAVLNRATENLKATGISFDWNTQIPPPIPDEKNIFKAPHMQEWFVGRTNRTLDKLLSSNQPFGNGHTITWAEIKVVVSTNELLAVKPLSNDLVLRWMDTSNAVLQVGPTFNSTNEENVKIAFYHASLEDVVKAMAHTMGINITLDPHVAKEKEITQTFPSVTPSQSLIAVLAANGLKLENGPEPKFKRVVPDPVDHGGLVPDEQRRWNC